VGISNVKRPVRVVGRGEAGNAIAIGRRDGNSESFLSVNTNCPRDGTKEGMNGGQGGTKETSCPKGMWVMKGGKGLR